MLIRREFFPERKKNQMNKITLKIFITNVLYSDILLQLNNNLIKFNHTFVFNNLKQNQSRFFSYFLFLCLYILSTGKNIEWYNGHLFFIKRNFYVRRSFWNKYCSLCWWWLIIWRCLAWPLSIKSHLRHLLLLLRNN